MTTTPDSSGNGFTGTLAGTPLPAQIASPWAGFTQAFQFALADVNGINCGPWDSGGVTAVSGVGVAATFTLEALVQMVGATGAGGVAGWHSADQPPQLWIDNTSATNAWGFFGTDNLASPIALSAGAADTAIHALAVDYDGITLRLYLDGTMIDSVLCTGINAYTSGDNFWIGSDDLGNSVNAILDEVRWSSVARYASDGGYVPAVAPFTTDADTIALYHLDTTFVAVSVEAVTTVWAGDPPSIRSYVQPPSPAPTPGPFGLHDYEVVACNQYGVATGVIRNAVVTQIDWELNAAQTAQIDFPILEPSGLLIPYDQIPGGVEVQIWRDNVLILWGWVVSATFDASAVHLVVTDLTWALSNLIMGPNATQYLTNPGFETGDLTGWTLVNCFAAAGTAPVALGTYAARLVAGNTPPTSGYIYQGYTSVTGSTGGFGAIFLASGWVYIDPNYAFSPAYGGPVTGNGSQNFGLELNLWSDSIDGTLVSTSMVAIDNSTPQGQWVRLETDLLFQPDNTTWVVEVRLYAPNGSVIWDDIKLTAPSSFATSPLGGSEDVTSVVRSTIAFATDPTLCKSDLALYNPANPAQQVVGPLSGVYTNQGFSLADNVNVLDLLNQWPTEGALDFAIQWDDTGHWRWFQVYPPAKGTVKYNYPVTIDAQTITGLQGAVDGTQVGTAQRVLGQGSGFAQDIGYAAFPSYIGGKVDEADGTLTISGTTVTTGSPFFAATDVGQPIYSLSGAIDLGVIIETFVSSTQVTMSKAAVKSATLDTIGVGGRIIDQSTSALPNQQLSILGASATGYLLRELTAQVLPTPKMRADGPAGMFGNVVQGDVIPVLLDYGWISAPDPSLMRIAKITLYPPTEELELQLMVVNAQP